MKNIIEQLDKLRQLSGNEQIDYLKSIKSDRLKQVLDYTYNQQKMYKIDCLKFQKIKVTSGLIKRTLKDNFTEDDWVNFTQCLDALCELRAVKDDTVRQVKYFITGFKDENVQNFLAMVLFKDLRLGLNIKKIQKVWPDFCDEPEVQLAEEYNGEQFEGGGVYSRKFDGKRMYILDNIAYSRANKKCKTEPIKHILEQLKQFNDYVFDGEILYFDEKGNEDFQKGISLTSSDVRNADCDNLYYVVFDCLRRQDFLNKSTSLPFSREYDYMVDLLDAKNEGKFGYSLLDTKFSHILVARQDLEIEPLNYLRHLNNWEGLMYRDLSVPYQFKRTSKLLKIKTMHDEEFKVLGMQLGTGKNSSVLGSLDIEVDGCKVSVGSGFTDEDRKLLTDFWDTIKEPLTSKYEVKVQYFEKTKNKQGETGLRFPVFKCFRHPMTMEELDCWQVIDKIRQEMYELKVGVICE